MSNFTINIQISAASASELITDLQSIASSLGCGAVLAEISQIKELLMTQDDSIKALKDANDALKTSTDAAFAEQAAALDNIKADEAAILAKIGGLSDLSPANQAIVDGVVADSKALSAKIQAQSDAVKAVADSIPDSTDPQP